MKSRKMKKKRRILDLLFSNRLWKDGNLIPNYRKPSACTYEHGLSKEKATSRVEEWPF
jgi:hypothetical protein